MQPAERVPVIVGVGEAVDHPQDLGEALEPVALMARALRAADIDCGGKVLGALESIEQVGLVSWRYADPVSLLCQRLDINPTHKASGSTGGHTPIRLLHEVALQIAKGELRNAAIVGGEAAYSRKRARKEGYRLRWTPMPPREQAARFRPSGTSLSALARHLGAADPAHIYPFFEMAAQSAWGQSPTSGIQESAELWEQYAAIAAQNASAWIQAAPSAHEIGEVTAGNRLISWPYSKLMVANPDVNQSAAVIVMSLAAARAAGVAEAKIIHIWGGAAAQESADFLERDRYDRSTAQSAVLRKAVDLVGGDAARFKFLELYSCFPVVPKMALRELGLDPKKHPPTVTGGLTFFGGPLHNYMSHAVCAMVRRLREAPGELGLLYGQGGYVNKHHALVLSTQPSSSPIALDHCVQVDADNARDPTPPLATDYEGLATIETYTVKFARDGAPMEGLVIARSPDGERVLARATAHDQETIERLVNPDSSAVGVVGHVRTDAFGKPSWSVNRPIPIAERRPRFCELDRRGPLTIVTINRPDVMNALHPLANAELAEIFDEFAADPDQWVAILTGAGERAFSAGNDLKYLAAANARGERPETPVTGWAGLTSRFDLDKPVIAAVNGVAMGGGFEIALACDIIVASERAVFALPEPKVGLAALAGGLQRLPRQIGYKQAMGVILTGRHVSAMEGLELGFVNEVTPDGRLMEAAERWADEILTNSPMSVRASKQAVRLGLEESSLAEAYKNQREYPAVNALFRSTDSKEGPLAFAQKRKPKWEGR